MTTVSSSPQPGSPSRSKPPSAKNTSLSPTRGRSGTPVTEAAATAAPASPAAAPKPVGDRTSGVPTAMTSSSLAQPKLQAKSTDSRGSTAGSARTGTVPEASSPQPNATASSSSSAVAGVGGPGFGPRQAQLQMYIADLLEREASPANSAKQVANLLIGYNTELWLLYDKYW